MNAAPQLPEPSSASPESTPFEPAPPIATARQTAMDRLAAQPAKPPSTLGLRLAWATSIFILVLALGSAYAWRSHVVAAWPPSERAYAFFGLNPAK